MLSGVFVIRMLQDDLVEHTEVVDAETKLIIDSEESEAIKPLAVNLPKWGGVNPLRLRVKKVQVVPRVEYR